ncbi:MAG: SURF1 family protein [Methylococcaceae bacterium]|nr:SURF1 family protein [Methylococcaceae bacterium]
MIIKIGRYSFKLEKAPTLIYLCLLPLLIALGIWQLGRSEEKRLFFEQQEHGLASSEIIPLSTAIGDNADALRYKKVLVTGHYDQAHQFLIDNQINAGKAGYFVLTPFVLQGETKAVLINRGWVPLNQNRSILPDVQLEKEQTVVTGRINRFPSVGAYSLFPFQLELDKDLPEGFKREWQTTTVMLPEQHTAYAMQWFALAFTLTILFIWYSNKRNDE